MSYYPLFSLHAATILSSPERKRGDSVPRRDPRADAWGWPATSEHAPGPFAACRHAEQAFQQAPMPTSRHGYDCLQENQPMSAETADVAIVGAGACGSLVARELAERGFSVVTLEAG